MGLPPIIENVRRRPSMFLQAETYESAVAFLTGFDAANSFGFLAGFREWLIVRSSINSNLGWPGIVKMLLADSAEQSNLIKGLFLLLEQFIDKRDSRDGLRKIFLEYELWLRKQEWYTPDSPDWLSEADEASMSPLKRRTARSQRRSNSKNHR